MREGTTRDKRDPLCPRWWWGEGMETELRLDSGVPTSLCGSYLPATSDGTREGLESLQGGVCLTRGMKVLLRVGQSEWGWGTS